MATDRRSPDAAYTPRDLAEQTLDHTLPYEETWHENATNVLALSDALIAMRDLAGVAHNGDPWYAENEGIDASAIFAQARAALGEESK